MNFNERRWPFFLRRRRARRTQEAEAFVQGGDALRDWLVAVSRDHSHAEAVDLFVEKVIRERISVAVVLWASEALDSKAFEVVSEGTARLDADKPSHWR